MKTAVAILIVFLALVIGLWVFSAHVAGSTPAPEPRKADGIVVLTGASNIRLEAAMRLLEAGKARRLLVSGVNREATRADIRGVTGAGKALYDCCVDLGFTAADTIGNARETAEWARAKDYRSLIIVTADYHMPRAEVELKAALPGVTLIAYPVRTESLDARRWWRTTRGARRMIFEYGKYLVILVRETFLSLGPKEPAAKAAPANGAAG
jgi:uncharacterized SAM-binding protein YcdF (DUF218 family)